jgi:hypothetical protein
MPTVPVPREPEPEPGEPEPAEPAEPARATAIESVRPAEPEAAEPDRKPEEPDVKPREPDVKAREPDVKAREAERAVVGFVKREELPEDARGQASVDHQAEAYTTSMARFIADYRGKPESKAVELKTDSTESRSPTPSDDRASARTPVTVEPADGSTRIEQFFREPPVLPEPRRRWGVFLVAAVVLAMIATGIALYLTRTSSGSGRSNEPGVASRTETRTGFPAGAPFLGSYISSQVQPNGDVVTDQWISLPGPASQITVSTRPLVAGSNDFTPNVKEIRVDLDGRPIKTEVAAFDTKTLSLGFPHAARYVHLHYVTTGVAISSAQSPKGRALVLINGLAVGGMPDSAADVVNTKGLAVLSMTCQKADTPPVPCGTQDGSTWSVRLSDHPSDTRVIAQVNLKK